MSIRDSRARNRRRLGGAPSGSGPVPHSARARRHNKLSLRRRRRIRNGEVAEVVAAEGPVVAMDLGSGLAPQRLSELTGLTPAMEKLLHGMGQTRFFQVAHWTTETICEVASKLGLDAAQIQASNWIGQARQRG